MGDRYAGEPDFPGGKMHVIPDTPPDAKTMLTAHRVDDTLKCLAHALERFHAACGSKTAMLRKYHSIHLDNHLSEALSQMHFLVQNLRDNYPAVAKELEALKQTVALAKAVDGPAKIATFAHLTETSLHELTHAKRHAMLMLKPDPLKTWEFNADHAGKHLHGAHEHVAKIREHLLDNYPAEAKWLGILEKLGNGEQDVKLVQYSGERWRYIPPTEPDSPYMFVGVDSGDIKTGAEAAYLFLLMSSPTASVFAVSKVPGKKDQYGLHQQPSQTVNPSPPLPPYTKLPTPKQVRALVKMVPDGVDISLSNTARNALEGAAVKLEKGDSVAALAQLRNAQSAIYAASRKDAGIGRPAVFGSSRAVYGPQAVPPAEQSSALAKMQLAYQQQSGAWRKVAAQLAALIERIRRNWFGGHINGVMPVPRV